MSFKKNLLWLGEHAYEVYKSADKNLIGDYNNIVLRFTRDNQSKYESENDAQYLDEHYPITEDQYTIEALTNPTSHFIRERELDRNNTLLIGDPCEFLFASVVNGVEMKTAGQVPSNEELFSMAAFKNVEQEVKLPNTMLMDVLFLPDALPFSDDKENSQHQKKIAKKWFKNVMECSNDRSSLNKFLSLYKTDVAAALGADSDIHLI